MIRQTLMIIALALSLGAPVLVSDGHGSAVFAFGRPVLPIVAVDQSNHAAIKAPLIQVAPQSGCGGGCNCKSG